MGKRLLGAEALTARRDFHRPVSRSSVQAYPHPLSAYSFAHKLQADPLASKDEAVALSEPVDYAGQVAGAEAVINVDRGDV